MLNFKKTGKGSALILIHGFCESLEMWDHWIPTLAETYTVFTLDLPGFGKSPLSDHHVTMESTAVIIQEWMDQNKIIDPVIIGHSLGGYITLALAELMGSAIKGIGLFHSTAFSDSEEKKHIRNKTYHFVEKFGVEKFIDSFVPPLFSEENRETNNKYIKKLIKAGKLSSIKGILSFINAMRDRKDRMEVWANFPNPKLMIAGIHDQAVSIEQSRMHSDYTDFYYELPNSGHMGMFEDSDNTLQIIQSYLENIRSRKTKPSN